MHLNREISIMDTKYYYVVIVLYIWAPILEADWR